MLGKTRILWVGILVQIFCLAVPVIAHAGKDKKKWHRSPENREKRKIQRQSERENHDGLTKAEREELRQLNRDHANGKFKSATEQDLKDALNNPDNSVIPNLATQYVQPKQVAPLDPPPSETDVVLERRPTQVDRYFREKLKVKEIEEFNLTAAMAKNIRTAFGSDTSTRAFRRSFLTRFFSASSEKVIGEVFRGLGRSDYNNVAIIGEPGVGKSHLTNQLVALYSFGIFPDSLKPQLGIREGSNAFANVRSAFIGFDGNTEVIAIKPQLFSYDYTEEGGMWSSEKVRVNVIINDLFKAAEKEFRQTGRRTLFLIDEIAAFPDEVRKPMIEALKTLTNNTGFKSPNDPLEKATDVGYSVVPLTTPTEWRMMVNGDGAIDRRYYKVKMLEPNEEETFNIVRRKAEKIWEPTHGLKIDDAAIRLLVRMRQVLQFPPEAMPGGVLTAANDLYLWRAANGGLDSSDRITIKDAQEYVMVKANRTPIWFEGPNGEPPGFDLEERWNKLVIGQEDAIRQLAPGIKEWIRTGGTGEPPVGIIIGTSGSGKDTLVLGLQYLLYGHWGKYTHFSLAGNEGFNVESIYEGPPLGNHSDKQPPRLLRAMENSPRGIIVLNEGKDSDSMSLEKLKVQWERGAIVPSGTDGRTYPITEITFLLGQWLEEKFEGKDDTSIQRIYDNLTQKDIDEALMNGRNNKKYGALSYALLSRAKKSLGVIAIKPVAKADYPKVVKTFLKGMIDDMNARKNVRATINDRLINFISDTAVENNEGTRGLSAIFMDFTRIALSEAMDQGLPQYNYDVDFDYLDGKIVLKVEDKEWKLDPNKLLRIKRAKKCSKVLTDPLA